MKKIEFFEFCKSFFFLCEEQGHHFYINNGRAFFESDNFGVEYFEEPYSENGYISLKNKNDQSFSLIELCHIVGGLDVDSDVEAVASCFHVNYDLILKSFDYIYESYHKKFDDYYPDTEKELVELERKWQKNVRAYLNV